MTRTCIYCLETKDEKCFDREHVIQQSMGVFDEFVLHTVCKDCNATFGRKIDGIFRRDSFEALLRHEHGLKADSKLHQLGKTRIALKVPPGLGDWSGVYIELYYKDGQKLAKPLPQVGLFNNQTQDYEYLLREAMSDFEFAKRPEFSPSKFKLIADKDNELDNLRELLNKAGWNPSIHGELAPPTRDGEGSLDLQIDARIDRYIKRAIAKIAFNYLAFNFQSRTDLNLLAHEQTDKLRRYIRYNDYPEFDPVQVTSNSLLHTDTVTNRQTHSHLIAIDWLFYTNGRKDLIVKVVPFNRINYCVTVISNYQPRPLPDISIGHEFDFRSSPVQIRRLAELSGAALLK